MKIPPKVLGAGFYVLMGFLFLGPGHTLALLGVYMLVSDFAEGHL